MTLNTVLSEASDIQSDAGSILLADDDICLLEITREILEELGYRVITASNGVEAVRQFIQHQQDIVLAVFDVMMPLMNGPEAAAHISAINGSLPFVFVTGFDSNGELKKAVIPQGYRMLQKPVDFNILSNVIQEMISLK